MNMAGYPRYEVKQLELQHEKQKSEAVDGDRAVGMKSEHQQVIPDWWDAINF